MLRLSKAPMPPEDPLQKPLRFVKGIGDKLALLFGKKELKTVRDLLYFFPRAYEDRRKIAKISELKVGMGVSVCGRIGRAHPVFFSRSRRRAFEIIMEEGETVRGQVLHLMWFNGPFIKNKLTPGTWVMATGTVQLYRSGLQMVHPEIEVLGKNLPEGVTAEGIVSVYSETEGLYQKTIRRIVQNAVRQYASNVPECLPADVLTENRWPSISSALLQLHCPLAQADFDELAAGKSPAHQRLIYEEFFFLALGLGIRRQLYQEQKGIAFSKPEKLWERFKENLPFQFTGAQKRVLKEILDDMSAARVMHRLVQGDVGCGKTVVAAAAALVALEAGYQVALMAPTELLVEQHFKNFTNWFKGFDIPLHMLSGSLTAKDRKEILNRLKEKKAQIVFGTHALFESQVEFASLGLVIVDEQHRFGVRQRARLVEKGESPDVLVMTATPIPRTLALTAYGDLDISVIDELPPGRKPIVTKVFTEKQRSLLEGKVLEEIKKGRQAYMVYPLIEESEVLKLKSIEKMFPTLQSAYGDFKIAFMHGKMDAEDRQKILRDFRENKIHILVSTTVVEVGVDIPNATVMVIENAERFGLSQLHQLRGRIGRGSEQSFCYLMAGHLGTPEIVKRLRTTETTHDGFKLAEVDLEMRGPGELLGTRQSGLPVFQLAQLPRDLKLLQNARRDAFALIDKDPALKEQSVLRDALKAKWASLELS